MRAAWRTSSQQRSGLGFQYTRVARIADKQFRPAAVTLKHYRTVRLMTSISSATLHFCSARSPETIACSTQPGMKPTGPEMAACAVAKGRKNSDRDGRRALFLYSDGLRRHCGPLHRGVGASRGHEEDKSAMPALGILVCLSVQPVECSMTVKTGHRFTQSMPVWQRLRFSVHTALNWNFQCLRKLNSTGWDTGYDRDDGQWCEGPRLRHGSRSKRDVASPHLPGSLLLFLLNWLPRQIRRSTNKVSN